MVKHWSTPLLGAVSEFAVPEIGPEVVSDMEKRHADIVDT